jgi:hypothetical protein
MRGYGVENQPCIFSNIRAYLPLLVRVLHFLEPGVTPDGLRTRR